MLLNACGIVLIALVITTMPHKAVTALVPQPTKQVNHYALNNTSSVVKQWKISTTIKTQTAISPREQMSPHPQFRSNFSNTTPLRHSTIRTPSCQPHFTPLVIMTALVYSLIFCSSIIGNTLVILTIVQHPPMRTPVNMFLLNLAVADLLRVLICLPPSLISIAFRCFLFGEILCHAISYMQPISVTASAFTLVVIAIERYIAICSPFRSREWQTRRHSTLMIGLVWLLAAVLNIPFGFYSVHQPIDEGVYNCRVVLPSQRITEAYWTSQVMIMFVVPLMVMTTLYILMIRTLQLGIRAENMAKFMELRRAREQEDTSLHSPERHILLRPFMSDNPASAMEFLAIPHFSLSPTAVPPSIGCGASHPLISIKSPFSNALSHRRLSANDSPYADSTTPTPSLLTPPISQSSALFRDRLASWTPQPSAHRPIVQKKIASRNNSSNASGSKFDETGGSESAALRSSNSERSARSKRRVIKMLVVIVVEFFICWVPFYIFLVLDAFRVLPWQAHPQLVYVLFSTFLMLAFLSSCTNPVTYCFMNKRFRSVLMQTYCLRACIKSTAGVGVKTNTTGKPNGAMIKATKVNNLLAKNVIKKHPLPNNGERMRSIRGYSSKNRLSVAWKNGANRAHNKVRSRRQSASMRSDLCNESHITVACASGHQERNISHL